MNYEASKQLTDARFKLLVGVQRTTFEEMLAVLKTAYQLKHAKGGRKPKLSLEDLLMATLQYVREYRTYEELANDSGKKKFHAMKAQAIVTSQGRIISLDIAVNYGHDMKLFKMSRRNIGQAGKILADSGY
ncbi:mobile genetic element [Streptococcus pneumoniae]|nr:mobile genetic element [Streptococcus pneumoniae]